MTEYRKTVHDPVTKYAFSDYAIADLPKEWLFSLEHEDDWQGWHDERDRMFDDVLRLAKERGCVGVWGGSRTWYYVHPSTRNGAMQVTHWDDKGPIGHVDVTDGHELSDAIRWNQFTAYTQAA